MQMYVCILWQSSILHDLQFVNAGRGCKRQPYGRGIFQSWSHDCFVSSHESFFVYFILLLGVFLSFVVVCVERV